MRDVERFASAVALPPLELRLSFTSVPEYLQLNWPWCSCWWILGSFPVQPQLGEPLPDPPQVPDMNRVARSAGQQAPISVER